MSATNGSHDNEIDCLVVGGGFAGVHALYRLRKEGYKTKLYEASKGLGGIWSNACYPGARVDTELPLYGLKFEEVYWSWNWSQRYPDYKEIRKYFEHAAKVLDLNKDCEFNSPVRQANWNDQTKRWDIVAGRKGEEKQLTCKFFIICTGFASKINWPAIPNRENYKGQLFHSGTWPDGLEADELKGKKIAVVGSGASGVQITQALGKVAKEMTVLIRTPNLVLPMHNPKISADQQEIMKDGYGAIFQRRLETFAGFACDFDYNDWTRHTPEEREQFFETLWNRKGFTFWLATYSEAYSKKECNDEMYKFWYKKVSPLVKDPKKREILCPPFEKAFHTFGTVRPSLQVDYLDILNQDNVNVVSVKQNPIKSFTETGFELADGQKLDFDVIVLATGYDTHTGGFRDLQITGENGKKLIDHWAKGPRTYLGLSTAGFPNMFSLYSAHGPTAYSNGPATTDIQADWVCDLLEYCKEKKVDKIVPTDEAEEAFCQKIWDDSAGSLFHASHGWYMGRNVPGKAVAPLNYTAGIPKYLKDLADSKDNDYKGWIKA